MNKNRFISCLLLVTFCLAKFVGIVPFSIWRGPQQPPEVRKSCFWRTHSYITFIIAASATPLALLTLYNKMVFLQQTDLLFFVGYNRYLLQLFCTLFTIFTQLRRDDKIRACFNQLLSCQHYAASTEFETRTALVLCIKLLTFPAAAAWTVFLILYDRAAEDLDFLLSILFLYYCQLVLQTVLTMFFIGMLFVRHHGQLLNRRLQLLLSWVACSNSFQAQRCCRLADEVEKMMILHSKLGRIGDVLMQLYSVQLLAFLTFALIECIVQLFLVYLSGGLSFGQRKAVFNPYAIVFMASIVLDTLLVIWICEEVKRSLSFTRIVLAEHSLHFHHQDISTRLNRSIDHFSIFLGIQPTAYSACGFFSFDSSLMRRLFLTTFNYLLILIQFDKILNKLL